MTALAGVAPAPSGGRAIVVGGRRIPVVLPSRRDPRLRLSAVILALQVLGQTVLGFKLSIAQILVSIGVCACLDAALIFRSGRVLAWPASGILTGNSVAFILRASGTRHGDWWSLHGVQWFVLACLLSLLSKHLIRPGGRHLFNPSNVGLVWTLLVIGPGLVFPQYLWWGPFGVPVALTFAVILLGGIWVLRSVRMIPMAVSFLVTLGVLVGLLAAGGRSFVAIWHNGPLTGTQYWANICLSPELLVFAFFMMSDPQTAPKAPRARVVYGAATAAVAAALLSFQSTEFGIKLAILSSLILTCALAPLMDKLTWRKVSGLAEPHPGPARQPEAVTRRLRRAAATPVAAAILIIVVAAPVATLRLIGNNEIIVIERGLTGSRNPQ
jgi:Na+-translocating ferredoxin:NAD+ oxidoreductase RnfD subunit